MSDALALAKHRLTLGLDRERLDVRPLNADQWAVKSLLQKAIRRASDRYFIDHAPACGERFRPIPDWGWGFAKDGAEFESYAP